MAPVRAAVVRCFGDPRVLDGLPAAGAATARVARDEAWLVSPSAARDALTQAAKSYLAGADPDGIVVDQTDGWSAWTITGPQAAMVLARLSTIELPSQRPAFVQGAVAEVPAKALAQAADRLHLIVPAQYAHHVSRRITQACADLDVKVLESREIAL
ncbi:MAG: hypothetical protein HY700_08410 [Gemmatimonadetes bacterium]|nr:hypothetical protein [Gemmatimonadota bacterium]